MLGDTVKVFKDSDFTERHLDDFDTAVFWGYVLTCQNIMNAYRSVPGKAAVYLDLAYWSRDTHFKVSVNNRHPTGYFQNKVHDGARCTIKPATCLVSYDPAEYILVAGMGPKAAWAERIEPVERWERETIARLRQLTSRPIVYRPKPSQHYGKPIPGVLLDTTTSIGKALRHAYAVVTHHSNVAVDGLIAGVPAFAEAGVASVLSRPIECIGDPLYPTLEAVQRFLNDVSYTQWSIPEMKSGVVWRHLKAEGMVK